MAATIQACSQYVRLSFMAYRNLFTIFLDSLHLAGGLFPTITAEWCALGSHQFNNVRSSCRTQLWDVPAIDPTNNATGGYSSIISTQIEIYNGLKVGRTYAHNPLLLLVNDTVVAVYSSGLSDEDSQGQQVWGSVSHDGGYNWLDPVQIMDSALLPNQTSEKNFTYW